MKYIIVPVARLIWGVFMFVWIGVFFFPTKEELRTWIDGAKHALWSFAVNQNGTMMVGSTGTTYKQALERLYQQYKEVTGEEYES